MKDTHSASGRAIVTFGRSYQALAAVQSLGRQGVEVIVCDEAPMMTAQFSRYVVDNFTHPSPKEDPDGYLNALEESVRRFKPEDHIPYVLMPIHEETRLIAENRGRFEPLARVSTPQIEAMNQVDPKHKLTATALRLGLPIPLTWQVASVEELDDLIP